MSSVFKTPAGFLGFGLMVVLVVLATIAHVIAPSDPFASVGSPLTPPSRTQTFGTDDLGRDVFAGIVHGTRTSLTRDVGRHRHRLDHGRRRGRRGRLSAAASTIC